MNTIANNPVLNSSLNDSAKICNNYVKWSAVIAGVAVGLTSAALLNFLGVGLGLANWDDSLSTLFRVGIGSIVWLSISGIFSMMLAGLVTGIITNVYCKQQLAIHGILIWCFATLFTFSIATSAAGTMVGGAAQVVGNSIASLSSQQKHGVASGVVLAGKAASNSSASNQESDDNSSVHDNVDVAANDVGQGAIALVIAFLLGAAASIFGVLWGANLGKYKNAAFLSNKI